MANIKAIDGSGLPIELSATGQGTELDPMVPKHTLVSPNGSYAPPLVASDLGTLARTADINALTTRLDSPLAVTGELSFDKTGLATSGDFAGLATSADFSTLATSGDFAGLALATGQADILTELQDLFVSSQETVTALTPAGGLATQTTLSAIATALGSTLSVNTGLTGLATETTSAALLTKLNGTVTVNTGLTGLATETTLGTRGSEATLATRATETTTAALLTKLNGSVTVNTGLTGLATQTTLATRASETTLASRATEATLLTRASSANQVTLITRLETIDTTLTGELKNIRVKGAPAQGALTITAAGTAQGLPAMALKNYLILQWVPSNTGAIYFGNAAVGNAYAGAFLDANNPRVVLEVANRADIWINADTAGDKVVYYCS